MKKTERIDDKARAFLSRSPFLAMTTCLPDGSVDLSARGGDPGFIRVLDDRSILIADHPANRLGDAAGHLDARPFVGLIALIPGVNETLRINGRTEVMDGPEPALRVTVDEMFYHCPKAFIRSHLWDTPALPDEQDALDLFSDGAVRLPALDARCRALIQRAPFLFLGTSQVDGNADVSPRGDPAGFVRMLEDRTLLLPDRPGNRLADSFTNILAHPYAALLFLIPGSSATLQVRARARIITDPNLLQPLAVEGRTPKVGVWLDVEDVRLGDPMLLQRSRLWDTAVRAERSSVPSIGELMVSQLACAGRADGLSPEMIDAGVERDAKENLY
jgi:PPOX class probable FMN-dependent enzyme